MNRRSYLKAAGVTGTAGLLSGCVGFGGPGSGGNGLRSFGFTTSGLPSFFGHYPWIVADEMGFFEEEDLEINYLLTGGGGNTTRALTSGEIQFAGDSVAAASNAFSAGADIQVIGSHDQKPGPFGIVTTTDSDIMTVQDMKGHSYGFTSPSGTTDTYARYTIEVADGIEIDDVEWTGMGGFSEILAGLNEGIIDTGALFEPLISGEENIRLVEYYGAYLSLPSTVISTDGDWADENFDMVVDVLRGVLQGSQALRERPGEAASVLANVENMAYSREQILNTIEAANELDSYHNVITEEVRSEIIAFIEFFGLMDEPVEENFDLLHRPEYMEEAMSS